MRASILVLASLACAGHARRVQKTGQLTQEASPLNDLTALAKLLQKAPPAAAFNPTGAGAGLGKRTSALKPSRVKCTLCANRLVCPMMQDREIFTDEDAGDFELDDRSEQEWGGADFDDGDYTEVDSGEFIPTAEERGVVFEVPPGATMTDNLKFDCRGTKFGPDKKVELILEPCTDTYEDAYFGFTADSDPAFSTDPYRSRVDKFGGKSVKLDVYFCPDELPGFNRETDYPSGEYTGTLCIIIPEEPSANRYYTCSAGMMNEPGGEDGDKVFDDPDDPYGFGKIGEDRQKEAAMWTKDDIMAEEDPDEDRKPTFEEVYGDQWSQGDGAGSSGQDGVGGGSDDDWELPTGSDPWR
mmetsp:Transcript_19809/g.35234  ORF Transcript_19809/g.35234 Transcript_19809/m.35234 type:complete len:355 (-) Transcript_19809:120-1184(-)